MSEPKTRSVAARNYATSVAILFAILVLPVLLLVGGLFMLWPRPSTFFPAPTALELTRRAPATAGPGSRGTDSTTTPWPPLVRVRQSEPSSYYPSIEHLGIVPIIADVEVEDLLDPRYSTPDGTLPTQEPGGSDDGLTVFTPVVLRVTRYYQGADVGADGFVVADWGGTTEEMEYVTSAGPHFSRGGEGPPEPGIAFLESLQGMPRMDDRYTRWIQALHNAADEQSAETGGTYLAASWVEYIEHDHDGDGRVESWKRPRSIEAFVITELIESVVDGSYVYPGYP